jgi:hypothetical protein
LEKSLSQNSHWRPRCALRFTLCAALFIAVAAGVSAQTGGEAGAYLRAPTGAAMTAMGGSQTASPPYLATWWNPAQLVNIDKNIFTFGTGLYSMGRTEAFSSLEFKLPPRVGIGLLCLYRGDPFINNLYSIDETKLPNAAFTTLTVKAALSYLVTRRLSAGLSIGVFYQNIPTSYNEDGAGAQTSLNYSDATSLSGFSLAVHYRATDSLTLAFVVRNVDVLQVLSGKPAGINFQWQLSQANTDYLPPQTDMILPAFVLGSTLRHHLLSRPLLWSLDIDGYLVDGTFTKLDQMEAHVHTGIEWQRWQTFRIRAGLDDIVFNRSMVSAPKDGIDYWHDFSLRVTAGFGWDVVSLGRGLTLNYSVATDKVWAGIDQMLDVVYKF